MREQIINDMKVAMKNQNKDKLSVIRMIKGAIQLEELNLKRELVDDEIIDVVTKQIKIRKEALIEFEKASRTDLIEKTKNELNILNEYMPVQLTEEEVDIKIKQVFEQINPTSMKDMGRVMAILNSDLKGKTDMSEVSKKVKNMLTNN